MTWKQELEKALKSMLKDMSDEPPQFGRISFEVIFEDHEAILRVSERERSKEVMFA